MTANADGFLRIADALHVASANGASDLHVTAHAPIVVRIDGALENLPGAPAGHDEIDAFLRALGAPIDNVAPERTTTWHQEGVVFRVHPYRAHDGMNLAVRILPRVVPTLESLHLPAVVTTLIEKERGLLVFAGPTGSGKSTSLAAALQHLNATRARRIITIEDPIEFIHRNQRSLITQREVGADTPSYRAALVGALRSDPDVIMLGELRDRETMNVALEAAETGHLILTTLHTGDVAQTLDRVIDSFEGASQSRVRAQLAQTLVGIVCQRLLRRATGEGRRALTEVLVATDAVRALIRDGRTHQIQNVIATSRSVGMMSFATHLEQLVARREVDASAARAYQNEGRLETERAS